jgi:hypothetical protein
MWLVEGFAALASRRTLPARGDVRGVPTALTVVGARRAIAGSQVASVPHAPTEISAIGSLPTTASARKEKGPSPTMTTPDIPLRRPTSAGFTFTVMAGD